MLEQLPSVEESVVFDYLGAPATAGTSLYDFLEPFDAGEIEFERVPFNHPLYIMYSRARPACRNASSTATAARCCST